MFRKVKESRNERDNGYTYHANYAIEGTDCSFFIGYVMLKGEKKIPSKFSEGLMAQGETGGEYSVRVIRIDRDRYQFSLPTQTAYLSDLKALKDALDLAEMMKAEIEIAVQELLQKERF